MNDPPKVMIVVGALARAGAEGQIVEFVRSAHPKIARCTVVCLSEPGPRSAEVVAAGANVASLDLRVGGTSAPARLPGRAGLLETVIFCHVPLRLPAIGTCPVACCSAVDAIYALRTVSDPPRGIVNSPPTWNIIGAPRARPVSYL